MKKFDLKKVAFTTMMAMGVLCVLLMVAVVYGVFILYKIDSGLPGAVALVLIGAWLSYDVTSMLNSVILDHFCELDVAREGNE